MRRFVIAVGALAIGACNTGGNAGGEGTGSEAQGVDELATMEFNLTPDPSFAYNSIYICANREYAADSKYPCESKKCECFNFDKDGKPYAKDGGQPRMENLCPTADYPVSKWDFTYTIFAKPNCYGDVITGPKPTYDPYAYNFVCFDAQDLNVQYYPDMSAKETLLIGENCNDIVCLTTNGSKTWDFDVCVDITPRPGCEQPGCDGERCLDQPTTDSVSMCRKLVLDCDCKSVPLYDGVVLTGDETTDSKIPRKCECGNQKFPLPKGCYFADVYSCKIVCEHPY